VYQRADTCLKTGGSVWLKHWAEENDKAGGNPDAARYILIYFAFGIGSVLLVVLQTLILWIFCSIEVGLPFSLLRSPESGVGACGWADPENPLLQAPWGKKQTSSTVLRLTVAMITLGFAQTSRADGLGGYEGAHVIFRNYPQRSHSESVLQVCFTLLHTDTHTRTS
jgi:hypothetical protein